MKPGILMLSAAHNAALKAYGRWVYATPGTRLKEALWKRFQNAEKEFEKQLCKIADRK